LGNKKAIRNDGFFTFAPPLGLPETSSGYPDASGLAQNNRYKKRVTN